MQVVALIGIDGSGKSTQARWLADWLTATGTPARYHRNAAGRVFLGRVARRLGRRDAEDLLGTGGLLAIETVLRWLVIARALLISRLTGTVAVMDRYSHCQLARVLIHRPHWLGTVRRLFAVFPQPSPVFFLGVRPEQAQTRVVARATDHETLEYLTALDRAYRALAEARDFIDVDGGEAREEVQAALRGYFSRTSDPNRTLSYTR